MVVVDNAQLTRIRLFRSKEVVKHGIFVFNITIKQQINGVVCASSVQEVISFNFNDLLDGRFHTMTYKALSSSNIFKNRSELKQALARQAKKYIKCCYIFSAPAPFEQRAFLAFVLDITHVQDYDDQIQESNLLDLVVPNEEENLTNYCWEDYLSITGNIKTASNMWFAENLYNSLLNEDGKFVEVKPTLMLSYAREDVNNDGSDQSMCSICLETISEKQQAIKLVRCGHMFHAQCIFKWLPKKKCCPMCRTSSSTNIYLHGLLKKKVTIKL